MSRGKRYADDGFDIDNIPWKKILLVLVVVIVIGLGIFGGKKVYSTLSVNNKVNKNDNNLEDVISVEELLPENISGYNVLGELKINSKNFSQYIVECNQNDSVQISNALNIGLVKLYGNSINEKGNFCIMGHNEEKYFYVLNELNIGDVFSVESQKTEKEYKVIDIYTIEPTELNCLMPNENYIELTLITCTTGSNQRLVVKAIEINDYEIYEKEKVSTNTIAE